MKRVVLDTNIYISGFLFDGPQRRILEQALIRRFQVFISDNIMSEIREVLSRPKFGLSTAQIHRMMSEIENLNELTESNDMLTDVCRDRDDHMIIECAVASGADYIVSGDNDLLTLGCYEVIKIVNSAKFLEIIHQ